MYWGQKAEIEAKNEGQSLLEKVYVCLATLMALDLTYWISLRSVL